MRAFIAMELPGEIRERLRRLQEQLATAQADVEPPARAGGGTPPRIGGVKWVAEDHLHVTMRFLGEITDAQRQAIERLLKTIADRANPIEAGLSHLGAFPSSASPRVIWVGIGQGSESLARIAGEIEEGLGELHLPKEERGFVPHVTLGRVRSPRNCGQLARRLSEIAWKPPGSFWIAGLTFFQSSLTSSEPIYTTLAKFSFGVP
jgi:2'-5' RNA ligase